MNDSTGASTKFLSPIWAMVLLFGAGYWAGSSRADPPRTAEVVAAVSAPFEYFPAGFVNQATEYGEHIPTF